MWASSSPVSLTELQDEIVPATGIRNSQVLRAAKDPSLLTNSGWSISKLILCLKKFYVQADVESREDALSIVSEDMEELLDFINTDYMTDSDESELEGFDDEDEESEGGITLGNDLFDLDNIDPEDFEIQENIFDYLPLNRFGPMGKVWGMPRFNTFFSGLDTLSRVLYKVPLTELICQQPREIPGILGVILTLITNKGWCSSGNEDMMTDLVEYELSVTSLTQSLKTDADYQNLNEDAIERAIAEIRTSMETAGDLTRPLYRQQIIRLSRALLYRRRKEEPENLTDISMPEYLHKVFLLMEDVVRKDVILRMDEHLRTAFLRSMLQQDLGEQEKLGRVTSHELAIMVESINQPIVTTLAIDAVWRAWQIGTDTGSYRAGNGICKL
jgi:hypothetical protein